MSLSICFAPLRVTLVSLDTRQKIVPLDRALEQMDGAKCVVVNGYFDPLTAAHVRRLRELHGEAARLVAVVIDPPEPLLPARARAELVAGLACVDCVVLEEAGLDPVVNAVHEEEADLERRDELIARVRARHEAGG